MLRALFTVLSFVFMASGISEANAAQRAQEMTVEEFLQQLSTVPDVMSKRDPFVKAAPPFSDEISGGNASSAPILERYPVQEYSIVAVLLGDRYPRALVKLPANEKGSVVIVREKDKLGNGGGVITRISKDGVTVLQNQRSPLGFIDKSEVLIPVGKGSGGA